MSKQNKKPSQPETTRVVFTPSVTPPAPPTKVVTVHFNKAVSALDHAMMLKCNADQCTVRDGSVWINTDRFSAIIPLDMVNSVDCR